MTHPTATRPLRIWDLPTRLFHLLLILCVTGLVVTAELGGDLMVWHFYLGYSVLTLVMFRLVWGLWGGHWSRFVHFVPTPSRLCTYLRAVRTQPHSPAVGHNPLGALSVLSMLFFLLAQVFSGLLSDDEIAAAGPWTHWAPSSWIEFATEYHTEIGKPILIVLVLLHVAAVLYHKRIQHDDLITPMLTGDKTLPSAMTDTTPASTDNGRTRSLALLVVAVCAYAAYRLVNWAGV